MDNNVRVTPRSTKDKLGYQEYFFRIPYEKLLQLNVNQFAWTLLPVTITFKKIAQGKKLSSDVVKRWRKKSTRDITNSTLMLKYWQCSILEASLTNRHRIALDALVKAGPGRFPE